MNHLGSSKSSKKCYSREHGNCIDERHVGRGGGDGTRGTGQDIENKLSVSDRLLFIPKLSLNYALLSQQVSRGLPLTCVFCKTGIFSEGSSQHFPEGPRREHSDCVKSAGSGWAPIASWGKSQSLPTSSCLQSD